jgi:hypothetical protein
MVALFWALHLHGMMYNKEFLAGDRREEQIKMNCSNCDSNNIRKNGQRREIFQIRRKS